MPKSYGRNERIAASLRREIGAIISSEIKDPRVSLATVTEVNVSPDLRNATIFVSFIDDDDSKVEQAMQVLNKASGFVRSTVAARLKMRYTPNIHFEFDALVKESMRLDALIKKGLAKSESYQSLADASVADEVEEYEDDSHVEAVGDSTENTEGASESADETQAK